MSAPAATVNAPAPALGPAPSSPAPAEAAKPSAPSPLAPGLGIAPTGLYRLPSWGWRILGGALRLIPIVLVLVGLPVAILTFLQAHGISTPLPILTVELFGIVIAILSVARYIMKPTFLFGPLAMAVSAVTLFYLYLFYLHSTYVLTIPNANVAIGLTYTDLVLLLMIVPALTLVAAALTTVEDLHAPKERLPFDFPP